jgi:hypothetical protein
MALWAKPGVVFLFEESAYFEQMPSEAFGLEFELPAYPTLRLNCIYRQLRKWAWCQGRTVADVEAVCHLSFRFYNNINIVTATEGGKATDQNDTKKRILKHHNLLKIKIIRISVRPQSSLQNITFELPMTDKTLIIRKNQNVAKKIRSC